MTKIRVGIVGCGEAAQILHIPALQHLAAKFEITRVSDVSERVATGVAKRLGVASSTDSAELVSSPEVDAVLITNPHLFHAGVAISALENGKHVFIEKPMCVTLAEADALAEAEHKSGKTVQIGYMRRYAGAFQEAIQLVAKRRGKIKFARVHDFIGANATIVADTSTVIRDLELAEESKERMKQLTLQRVAEGIGPGPEARVNSYMLLLGLSSHDISAMRDIIGLPRDVLHASARQTGRCMTAVFDYGDFVCEFATGIDTLPRYDTFIEVFCQDAVVRVDWDTPYVRNLPARLTVHTAEGEGGVKSVESYPSRLDTFVIEWDTFHANVTTATTPKCSIADARKDILLFQEMIAAMYPEHKVAAAAADEAVQPS